MNDENPNCIDAVLAVLIVVAVMAVVVVVAMRFAEWLGLGNMIS